MNQKKELPFDAKMLLSKANGGRTVATYAVNQIIYQQGDPADSVFYIQAGKVKLAVTSEEGKEAIVAILKADDFFGEAVRKRRDPAFVNGDRSDGMYDHTNSESRDQKTDSRRADVCRVFYLAPLGSQRSCSSGFG